MKLNVNTKIFPLFSLGAGGIGLALRIWFFSTRDGRGLLPAAHFADTLCYLIFAAILAVIFLSSRQLPSGGKYTRLFPAGLLPAAGCMIGGAGILYTSIADAVAKLPLSAIALVLGIGAAACLVLLGLLRLKGGRPSVYLLLVPALYLMLHAVLQVRVWSSETQLTVIFFPLLASLFLTVAVYYHAHLAVRQEGLRQLVFFRQAALFLCCLSLSSDFPLFYMGMAAWLGCDLCRLPAAPREDA